MPSVPKPPPKQKKRKRLQKHTRLKCKRKPTPKSVISKVKERDGIYCQHPYCNRLAVEPHHIRFQSGSSPQWKHDPRNIVLLCSEHHIPFIHSGKEANKWRRYWERWAVEQFCWLGGQAITLEEYDELRELKKIYREVSK